MLIQKYQAGKEIDICMACWSAGHWHLSRQCLMLALSKVVIEPQRFFTKVITGRINYPERNMFEYFSCVSPSIFKTISD